MNTNRNLGIAAAALAIVVALGVGLFIWPNYREASTLNDQTAQMQQKIEGLASQNSVLEALSDKINDINRHVEKELKTIPETPDLAGLIRTLSQDVDRTVVLDQTFTAGSASEAIANLPGGPVEAATPTASGVKGAPAIAAPKSPTVMAMPLTVDMTAQFAPILALVRTAESVDRLVRVASVRITCKRDEKAVGAGAAKQSGSSDRPVLAATIGLEAIYSAADPAVAAATNREGP